mgnify:FL=1
MAAGTRALPTGSTPSAIVGLAFSHERRPAGGVDWATGTYMTVLDDFDHGILSPSGRVSKRTRKVALAKLAARVNDAMAAAEESRQASFEAKLPQHLRQQATELRRLADLGMRPKAHRYLASKLEAEADRLDAELLNTSL